MPDLRALYQQAFDAFVRQDYESAVAAYHRVLDEDPRFVLALQGLAEACARMGRLDEAIAAIERAIEIDPTESLFHISLSRFLQRQGRIPEAEAAAAAAARLAR